MMDVARPAVLRGLTWDHPRAIEPLVTASEHWERQHPEVRVIWSVRSLRAFGDQPLAEVVDDHELVILDHPHIPDAVSRGLLAPLSVTGREADLAKLATESVGPSFQSYLHDGVQWALPVDAAAQVAVYRPDLLGEPPRAWDEVLELAASERVLWPAVGFASFGTIAANRGTPVAPETGGLIAEDDGLAVLAHLHRLAELIPDWCLSADPVRVCEVLAKGNDAAYAPLLFGYVNYSLEGFRRHRLRFVDMPSFGETPVGSCLGGAGVAVSASSPHVGAATRFAFWLASAECQSGLYSAAGGQPANTVAWADHAADGRSLRFYSGTRATLEGAFVRPRLERWMDVQLTVGASVGHALRKEIDDRSAVRRMNEAFDRAIEGGTPGQRREH